MKTVTKQVEKIIPKRSGKQAAGGKAGAPKSVQKSAAGKGAIREGSISSSWGPKEPAHSLVGRFDDITGKLPVIVSVALKGVKPELFYDFANRIDMPDKYLADLLNISTRTLSNYKEHKRKLDPVRGEHLLKMIALFKKGEEIFGRLSEFQGWLLKPQPGRKEKPVEWLVTPGGIDLISLELERIAHGYAL